jgi:hypothetical protein
LDELNAASKQIITKGFKSIIALFRDYNPPVKTHRFGYLDESSRAITRKLPLNYHQTILLSTDSEIRKVC